jgi:glycosyltransferase involved in cell wall biosynthesis
LKEYDIIHFHELDFSFPLFSFFVRKPKIFHLHGIDVDFLKKYHLNRVILKHVADYYISITRQMERDLVELGISRSRIMYLPNAVNGELFRPHGGKEDNLLLFVGRISFEKGLHVLLDSLRDQPEVAKWCQKASILILPSFYEAFPVVILEALSCETPVIATPVGGIPELVRDYENGFLIPPNNPLKLAEAIEYLLDNKDIRIRMGKAGRKRGVKDFSLEIVAQKLRRVYEQIITTS